MAVHFPRTLPGARRVRRSRPLPRPRDEWRPDLDRTAQDLARIAFIRMLVAVIASAIVTTTVIAVGAVWMPSACGNHARITGPVRR